MIFRKFKNHKYLLDQETVDLIVGWLFGFYGISTFVGYLKPIPFLYK